MTRILIAEDNSLIALAMMTCLERAGYEVVGPRAATAPALEAARQTLPELALVDIDLQGGDSGVELALQLHAELEVRTLFVTGQFAEVSDLFESQESQSAALGALGKPFRGKALLAAVDGALALIRTGTVPEPDRQLLWFDQSKPSR